jgi:predicted helicase
MMNPMKLQPRPHQERGDAAMQKYPKGQLIYPTGGGKTLNMIMDAVREFSEEVVFEKEYHLGEFVGGTTNRKLIVVVAPRILLTEQLSSEFLEFITNAAVLHVHSGETSHKSTTNPDEIDEWVCDNVDKHCLIFTTYNSLERLQDADVAVDTIYFDEAHNSVKRNFFPATEHFAAEARRCYFFTATPKHSLAVGKPGMNDSAVYGQVICKVPAPELVAGGFIVPPKVIVKQLEMVQGKQTNFDRDAENLLETIDDNEVSKILICAKATKQIVSLVSETDFCSELESRGFSWMYITAKTGAVIDGKKVNREVFFDTLSAWGKDNDKKFVVLHHSILAEGINVSGLEAVLFLRNMDFIGISQTIGRCIRLHHDDAKGLRDGSIKPGNLGQYTKSFGLVCVPVYSKVGITTAKAVQSVVDTIFQKGEPAISVVRR